MKAIAKALIEAQKKFGPIKLTKTNPHFKSKYADLSEIMAAVGGPLRDAGLVLTHSCTIDGQTVCVTTRLIHADSGEMLDNAVTMPVERQNAQSVGSAITYGRRYGLSALLAIVADADDDGNGATDAQPQKPPARAARKPAAKPGPEPAEEPVPMGETDDDAASALNAALGKLLKWTNERVPEGKPPWDMARLKKQLEAKATIAKREIDADYVEEVLFDAQEREAMKHG